MRQLLTVLVMSALMSAPVQAAMLGFDIQPSQFFYDHTTQSMTASGVVTVSDVGADVVGLSFNLQAVLASVTAQAGVVTATFVGVPGFELEVPGQLTGDLVSLIMAGAEGADFGVVFGLFDLSGPLASAFGQQAGLFSLQLNMSEVFSEALFRDLSFRAQLNGGLTTAVPAPATGLFIGAMLLLVGLQVARRAVP